MVLTPARKALLLPLAVKRKSVLFLVVQIPFMVETVCLCAIIFSSCLKTHHEENRWCNLIKRQHGKDGFSVTKSTVIGSEHFKTDDIKKTLTVASAVC